MKTRKPDLKSLLATANRDVEKARRFGVVGFVVLVALLYGFLFLRISSLNDAEPSSDSVTGQVQAAGVPHIDESVVKQLESLHDNSVNVRTLFNEARKNPFSN
jgi:hypothetical protein